MKNKIKYALGIYEMAEGFPTQEDLEWEILHSLKLLGLNENEQWNIKKVRSVYPSRISKDDYKRLMLDSISSGKIIKISSEEFRFNENQ